MILLSRIQSDDRARVSFALMGVLMLVLGSFSAIYISSVNKDHVNDMIEESHYDKMKNTAALIHEEVESRAYYHGLSAVYTSTQVLYDQKNIQPIFNRTFGEYINESFPKSENNMEITVENYTVGIFFDSKNTLDVVPTNEQEETKLKGKGKEVKSKTMKNDKAGEFSETSCIAYYTVCGELNYTVRDESSGRFLKKSMSLERRLDSAYPLLDSKLKVLDAGAGGMVTPIPRTVKYILTTLAQFRVLQGYGMGKLAAASLELPDKKTSQIVTKSDAELALNLAVLLETARLYRTYDDEALGAMDSDFQNNEDPDYTPTNNPRMQELVQDYVTNGTIDAADIIAIFLGVEKKGLNVEAIIAQAINAIADQFILKYLDYFGLADIADALFVGVQVIGNAIKAAGKAVDDFVGWICGESPDEKNLKRIKNWVRHTIKKEAGLSDTTLMHDTQVTLDSLTYDITMSKAGECQHWEDDDGDPQTPDVPVKYEWSTVVNYDVEIEAGEYPVDFTEKDILRKGMNDLWYDPDSKSDFYDLKYEGNTNKIYTKLRDVVKAMIGDVVMVISELEDLDLSPYKELSRPKNLNPKDDVSLLEEVRSKVDGAVGTIKSYFSGSDGKARVRKLITLLVDEQAKSISNLQDFIKEHFHEFAKKDTNIEDAKEDMAEHLISNARVTKVSQINGGEHKDCAPDEPFTNSEVKVKFTIESQDDVEKDIKDYVEDAYEDVKEEELSTKNNGKAGKPLYIIGGIENVIDKTSNTVVDLITEAVHGFGLIPLGCDMVKVFAKDIIFGGEVVNTKYLQYTKVGVPFEFWEDDYEVAKGQGSIENEILRVDQEPNYLFKDKELEIQISAPKGTHYTDILSISTRPFETNWDVSISGEIELTTRTESRLFLTEGTHEFTKANNSIEIELSIPVTVYSGWNLEDVDYELSNTLLGDIIKFLTQVWDYIVSVVGAVFDALGKLVESFMEMLTKLISYVAELIKMIVDTIQFFVELIMDFIHFIMDTIVKDLIEIVADIIGDGITISVFGFTFEIKANKEVAQDDEANGDLLWVTTGGKIADIDLEFTLRFARYHKEDDTDPHYDILMDGHIEVGDFILELAVDPLMAINSHIVEGHGTCLSEDETGWGIDFFVPEIEEYKEVKWCLDDVAGGMNAIPIPFLGVNAKIDAGFVIQYNAPKGDDVVINEFELNCAGEDEGFEWFEIYNPNGEDIDNWMVSSAHGNLIKEKLSELESENEGVYTVFTLPKEVLDNGESNNPFKPGDGLIIMDNKGNVVDRTPIFKDPGDGDKNTWQRSYDGSVIWKFKQETQIATNGEEKLDIKSEIMAALKTSFNLAWTVMWEKDLGIDPIIEFIQDWIRNFIDMVITLIADVVIKVYLYLDLAFEDVSGSAAGGIRLTLGMDSEGLETLLRWLVDTVETFIYNICNPANPETYPSIPRKIPEHMHIRIEIYFEISPPKIIEKISSEELEQCRLAIAVQANIPALVQLLGWDWGDWEIVIGAYLAGLPSKAFSDIFGTSDEEGVKVDIWLLKARIYEIPQTTP